MFRLKNSLLIYLNNMKKYTATIFASILTLGVPLASLCAETINIGITNPIKSNSVSQVLLAFFKILVEIGAVAVTLAIVYAGFLFVVARGNPEQLNKAKTTFFWTIIGAMILLGAQVIASVIQKTIEKL